MSTHGTINDQDDYAPLVWRIGVAMAEAGIRTNRELKKRLAAAGYKTSEATLSRLRKVDLRAIELDLLAALCTVLATTPDELLAPKGGWPKKNVRVTPTTQPAAISDSAENRPLIKETPIPETSNASEPTMLGPRITPVNPLLSDRK